MKKLTNSIIAEFYCEDTSSAEAEVMAYARAVALKLGHSDFPAGSRLHVIDEYGETIIRIPLVRLHS